MPSAMLTAMASLRLRPPVLRYQAAVVSRGPNSRGRYGSRIGVMSLAKRMRYP